MILFRKKRKHIITICSLPKCGFFCIQRKSSYIIYLSIYLSVSPIRLLLCSLFLLSFLCFKTFVRCQNLFCCLGLLRATEHTHKTWPCTKYLGENTSFTTMYMYVCTCMYTLHTIPGKKIIKTTATQISEQIFASSFLLIFGIFASFFDVLCRFFFKLADFFP